MTFLKSTVVMALLLTSITASGNELGLTEAELQSLIGLSPTLAKEKSIKPDKVVANKSKATKKKVPLKPSKTVTTKVSKQIIKPKTVTKKTIQENAPVRKPKSSDSAFDCQKKYCKYMTSCAEAKYKLKQCGHSRLDRDKDGIPCENVCL